MVLVNAHWDVELTCYNKALPNDLAIIGEDDGQQVADDAGSIDAARLEAHMYELHNGC
jgi:hypothetical protein